MFISNFAREVTRLLNAVKVPHRIVINKSNGRRTPGPPSEIFDTTVTVYVRSDVKPKGTRMPAFDLTKITP